MSRAAIIITIILVGLVLTEFVACEWHADELTHGCQSNPIDCLPKK